MKFISIHSDIATYYSIFSNLVSNVLSNLLFLQYTMQSISKVGANNINYSFSNEINIPFVVYIFIFCLPAFVSYSSLLFLEKQSKCKLSLYLFYMSKYISQNIILSNVEYGMNTIFFVFLMVTMLCQYFLVSIYVQLAGLTLQKLK